MPGLRSRRLLFTLLAAFPIAACLAPPATSPQAPAGGLAFFLGASKPLYVLYEPVLLTLRLSNPTEKIVTVDGMLHTATGDVQISITGPDGVKRRYHPGAFIDVFGARMTLNPGESQESVEFVLWSAPEGRLAFPAPGLYQVEAAAGVPSEGTRSGMLESAVEIRITAPADPDVKLIEHLGSPDVLADLLRRTSSDYCRGKPAQPCIDGLRRLASENSESSYAPFLLYDLAEGIEIGSFGGPPDPRLAAGQYKYLLRRWPGHGLRESLYTRLALSLIEAGDRGAAAKYASMLETEFPAMKESIKAVRDGLAGRRDD